MLDKTIWFDLENAPHVWILKEFIEKFESENCKTVITARDFSSTISLCEYLKIKYKNISIEKTFRTKYGKFYGAFCRSLKLKNYISQLKIKPTLAISHGSRSQALAAYLKNIPVLSLDDYEYSFKYFNMFVTDLLTPSVIPKDEWGFFRKKVTHYPGLKEELYLWNIKNYSSISCDLIKNDRINILFRPEGKFTHYHSEKSRELQDRILKLFSERKELYIILLARDKEQEKELEEYFIRESINYFIPKNALNGPALLYNVDLVIGGGGTMTREAALLGTPAYTFFGGKLGHVDKYLIDNKKLTIINSASDFEKIKFVKRMNREVDVKPRVFQFVYEFIKKNYLN